MVYSKKTTSKQQGFTLVEILIAMTIAAVLASVMMVSLSGARSGSKDGRIRANMDQLNALAETLYAGGYPSTLKTPYVSAGCALQTGVDATVITLGADIMSLNGITNCGPVNNGELRIYNGTSAYGATAKLTSGTFWCIDSRGISQGGYATRSAALTDALDYTCN